MHGVRAAAPEKETRQALEAEPLYEAERLRIIYQLITNAKNEGGAGITPKSGQWENVESIFALHDHEANKRWIKHWGTSYFLKAEDLDDIRNRLGEKVCFHSEIIDPERMILMCLLDRLLFRLHAVLFHLPHLPRRRRIIGLVPSRPLLPLLRRHQLAVVHRLHRILETPRSRLGSALGRSRRLQDRLA
jgi:hypothetical protein